MLSLSVCIIPNVTQAITLKSGNLITDKKRGKKGPVFLVSNNKRLTVLNADVFRQRSYKWKNVKRVSRAKLTSIPVWRALGYKKGTLIKSKNKSRIWIMDKGRKKFISSKNALQILGLTNKKVRTISYKNLFRIRPGGAMDLGITKFIAATSINKPFWVKDGQSNNIIQLKPREIVKVGYKRGIYLISIPTRSKIIQTKRWVQILPSSGGIVKLPYYDKAYSYNKYRGGMWIKYSSKSKRLWAINKVKLEDYLKGMGEVGPTTHLTAQKVMAIVARSYAGRHIQNGGRYSGETFFLKDSRYNNGSDQVYRGYKNEFIKQKTAVNQTRKIFVTTGTGKITLTPYSHGGYVKYYNLWKSNPDRETRSHCINNKGQWLTNQKVCLRTMRPNEIWWSGSSIPYCKAVSDPHADRQRECGPGGNHCVGLSAHGAIGYANNGVGYVRILKHYYPGAKVQYKSYNPWNRVAIYGLRP